MITASRSRHLSVVPTGRAIIPPSERPGRRGVAAYRLRVELEAVSPTVWRRFVVPSNLRLHELHPILQTVMGWLDCHAQTWAAGEPPVLERYEMREYIEETFGGDELCEDDILLCQILTHPGDELSYAYDLGEGWSHKVVLEEVESNDSAPYIRCQSGARACPPENCGGPTGYANLVKALADPAHPDHRDVGAWLGPGFSPESFDLDATNIDLWIQDSIRGRGLESERKFAAFLRRIPHRGKPQVYSLLEPVHPTSRLGNLEEAQEAATLHLRWLLNELGSDGITLTRSGYLPTALVAAARRELPGFDRWPGTSDRERDQRSVTLLREYARTLGLVRKCNGKLMPTKFGFEAAESPSRLWYHLLDRMPLGRNGEERDAGYLALLVLAAGASAAERCGEIVEVLSALGWGKIDENVIAEDKFFLSAFPTIQFCQLIGAMGGGISMPTGMRHPEWLRLFARMVLLN